MSDDLIEVPQTDLEDHHAAFGKDLVTIREAGTNAFLLVNKFGTVTPKHYAENEDGKDDYDVTGLYENDTVGLTQFKVSYDGRRLKQSESSLSDDNVEYRTRGEDKDIAVTNTIIMRQGVMMRRIEVENKTADLLDVPITNEVSGGFDDIFKLRGAKGLMSGEVTSTATAQSVRFSHNGLDGKTRTCAAAFSQAPVECETGDGVTYTSRFNLTIPPGETRTLIIAAGDPVAEDFVPTEENFAEARDTARANYNRLLKSGVSVSSSNDVFNHTLQTSQRDLVNLTGLTDEGEEIIYAGIPFFFTIFGRDAIKTAKQVMPFRPAAAKSIIRFLCNNLSTEINPAIASDDEGKALHEQRRGESSGSKQNPYAFYYGSVDVTPSLISLAAEYMDRTGDKALIAEVWPQLEKAIGWMERNGDRYGDGILRHEMDPNGLGTQNWEDSDGGMYLRRTVVETALDAATACADLAERDGDDNLARKYREEAQSLTSSLTLHHSAASDELTNAQLKQYALDTYQRAGQIAEKLGDLKSAKTFETYIADIDDLMIKRGGDRMWRKPTGPLAQGDVQGYGYEAYLGAATMARAFGLDDQAADYTSRAGRLKQAFNDKFWSDDLRCYQQSIGGVPGGKETPQNVIGSNTGQSLDKGIIDHDRAAIVVETLMDPRYFSGWGIRTLGTDEPHYKHDGYHNGPVWPHNSNEIANGILKMGFAKEAEKIYRGVFLASIWFDGRLPELHSGEPMFVDPNDIEKLDDPKFLFEVITLLHAKNADGLKKLGINPPKEIPQACRPQAWAAGATLETVANQTGLKVDHANETWTCNNNLPAWMGHILLENVRVGSQTRNIVIENFNCPDPVPASWRPPANQNDLASSINRPVLQPGLH